MFFYMSPTINAGAQGRSRVSAVSDNKTRATKRTKVGLDDDDDDFMDDATSYAASPFMHDIDPMRSGGLDPLRGAALNLSELPASPDCEMFGPRHVPEPPAINVPLVCHQCKAVTREPYNCPCRRVVYCGIACQTAHWPEHKLVCTGTPQCQVCGSRGAEPHGSDLVQCACREAIYCGPACQGIGWRTHEAECSWAERRQSSNPSLGLASLDVGTKELFKAPERKSAHVSDDDNYDDDDDDDEVDASPSPRRAGLSTKQHSVRTKMRAMQMQEAQAPAHEKEHHPEPLEASLTASTTEHGSDSADAGEGILPDTPSASALKDDVAALLSGEGGLGSPHPQAGSFHAAASPRDQMEMQQLIMDHGERVPKREAPNELKDALDSLVPGLLKNRRGTAPVVHPDTHTRGAVKAAAATRCASARRPAERQGEGSQAAAGPRTRC
eukprot:TRINITY_DN11566_c6_g1_i1.p1 TRINITY_DN11566_c6_g1~~TRINITY_DN11566_c6_g1_i1.p1  ORF type:complete len:440 (+),score=84.07 TRINITY_DN11566_c6_g1_i1:86-1405(+)